jgi:hypothetical protein
LVQGFTLKLLFIVIGDFELLDKFKVAKTPTRYGRLPVLQDENFNNSEVNIRAVYFS